MFLVIGSTTLDLIQRGIRQMPSARGDEFTVDSLVFCEEPTQMRFGGNGANSAYALAKLGATVALGSAIGRDAAGTLLAQPLQEIGVDLRGLLHHAGAATSVTTVLSDQARNRFSFHHAGSSHAYTPADLPQALVQRTTALLAASYTLFLRWRPDGFATLLQQVKAQGGITALDIGPAIGEPATLAEIAVFLPAVDYFLCNAHELAVCTGGEPTEAGLAQGMAQILRAGGGCVVIKRGAAGALVQQRVDEAPLVVPGFPATVPDTVGAGDSFNAGFLYAVSEGRDAVTAAHFANGVAALVIRSQRGVLGGPTADEVNALLDTQ
ncbi:MAG TPA: carbohydrate kinase family protein [Caldilineaceae bacterium]|nr:carbohydrate kinase family protein [Caldilineaceae bacterium]